MLNNLFLLNVQVYYNICFGLLIFELACFEINITKFINNFFYTYIITNNILLVILYAKLQIKKFLLTKIIR